MMKKLLVLTLVFGMVLSMVQMPVSAEESKSFYADFDSYSVGAIGKNVNVNGTGSKLFSSWFSIINEATGNTTDSYINRTNFITDTELVSDGGNDKSLKITVPTTESVAVELQAVAKLNVVPDTYIHFGYDVKLGDTNGRSICLYYNDNSGKDYDFTTFGNDGIIKFYGESLGNYVINKWYNFDVYYNTTSGKWIVYVNNELVLITTSKMTNMTEISKLIFKLGGSGTAATTYLDEICIGIMPESDVTNIIPSFYADFNSYTANKAFDTSNGATSYGSWGNYFPNEAGDNGRGSIAAKVYDNTTVTIAQDVNGDKVVKFISAGTYKDKDKEEVYIHGDQLKQAVASGDILHFAYDFMTEDMNCVKGFTLKDDTASYIWDFVKFDTDGTVKMFEKVLATYSVNTWYDVDIYYNTSTGEWYLYINDTYQGKIVSKKNLSNITVVRVRWFAPNGKITTVYVDDLLCGKITSSYFADILPSLSLNNTINVIENPVTPKSVLLNVTSPEALAGTVIIALYNGNELSEVKTFPASEKIYASFTESGNEAKVMWWNGTTSNLTPIIDSIPVNFAD